MALFKTFCALAWANIGGEQLKAAENHVFMHLKWSRNNSGKKIILDHFLTCMSPLLTLPLQHGRGAPLLGANGALKDVSCVEVACKRSHSSLLITTRVANT